MELKSFVIGILICFVLSFAVGLERQYRRRFIGLRTTILLAIGTYMFVSNISNTGCNITYNSNLPSDLVYIIVEYTKTTD